jgi:hypothetical protein
LAEIEGGEEGRRLPLRHVDFASRPLVERLVPDVGHDGDDAAFGSVHHQAPRQRIAPLAGELRGQRLVDRDHGLRRPGVARVEIAASDDADADGLEISGADDAAEGAIGSAAPG